MPQHFSLTSRLAELKQQPRTQQQWKRTKDARKRDDVEDGEGMGKVQAMEEAVDHTEGTEGDAEVMVGEGEGAEAEEAMEEVHSLVACGLVDGQRHEGQS